MKMFQRRAGRKGFTMIELMVVVVIVGVLAAIAIPLYGKYVKSARMTEATGRIGEIITACKVWAQDHQDDVTGNPTWPPAGGGGIVDLGASDLFGYAITSGANGDATTTALTITASGTAGKKMEGVSVTVTVNNISSNGTPPVVTGM
jgi:prepilin-type N-terminal cleavage/methylation domain-containing protein